MPEKINISPESRTPKDVMLDLLRDNPGVAVGETHDTTEARQLLSENMAAYKAAGVDTLYMEGPKEFIDKLSKSSPDEIERLKLATEHFVDNPGEANKNPLAQLGVEKSLKENDLPSYLEVARSAKENGVRIAPIDGTANYMGRQMDGPIGNRVLDAIFPPRDLDGNLVNTGFSNRVGETNKSWVKAISEDRKKVDPEGKYLILGGAAHFNEVRTMRAKGQVDDKLGIPTVAFTKSPDSGPDSESFYEPHKPGHPDVYFNAGPDYKYDIEELLRSEAPRKPASEKEEPEKSGRDTPPPGAAEAKAVAASLAGKAELISDGSILGDPQGNPNSAVPGAPAEKASPSVSRF